MSKSDRPHIITMEMIVGAFMFIVIFALGYFTILLGADKILKDSYEYEVVFKDVMGLRKGDNVVVRGMPVGTVHELELHADWVRATLSLEQPIVIHDDYRVRVVSTSVLGGNNLLIETGSENAPVLATDTPLRGEPPIALVEEASVFMQDLRTKFEEENIIENLGSALADIREITDKINSGEGALARLLNEPTLYTDLAQVSSNLNTITSGLAKGEGTLGRLLTEDKVYEDLAAITDSLASGESTLGRLMSGDGKLYEDLEASIANLRDVSERINSGKGALGMLISDESFAQEISDVVSEARATLDDLRENSPIVTFSSVLFGAF